MKWGYWKRPLYPVPIEVDKVLFPDGSELESSDQLLTTEDLTALAAQLEAGASLSDIAGGVSYATSDDLVELRTSLEQFLLDANIQAVIEKVIEHDETIVVHTASIETISSYTDSIAAMIQRGVEVEEILKAHSAILRAVTQLVPAQSEVSTQEGLEATAIDAQTDADALFNAKTLANATAQQELSDARAHPGYTTEEYFFHTNTYFEIKVKDAPSSSIDTHDEYTISTWTGGEPNFDANLLVFINSPEISLVANGIVAVTLPASHFDDMRQGHKDAVREEIPAGSLSFYSYHYFLGPKLNREGNDLLYTYSLFSEEESGNFYKQSPIDTSAEEIAAAAAALALIQAEEDKATADKAVIDVQTELDAANVLVTEIKSDQSQAFVTLNWVGDSAEPDPEADGATSGVEDAQTQTQPTPTVTETEPIVTETDPPKKTHWVQPQTWTHPGTHVMNVAGIDNDSYELTYAIGDRIVIGGYTDHIEPLTTYGGLSPDFINGVHIIVGFETDTTSTDYTFSFNVAIPSELNFAGATAFGTTIEAWTKPYLQGSGVTEETSVIADEDLTSDGTLD